MIPTLQAHIAEYDDYWKQRALQAKENTDAAYHPNPEVVTEHFNHNVARYTRLIDMSFDCFRLDMWIWLT